MDIRLITRKATIQTLLTLVTWTVLAQNTGLQIDLNSNLGSPAGAQLFLFETENDYARLRFTNSLYHPTTNNRFWDIAGIIGTDNSGVNDRLNFYNRGFGDILSLRGNGKVGIRTTSRVYTLDVVGEINLLKGQSFGQALLINGNEAIGYNNGKMTWGDGASQNHFTSFVGINVSNAAKTLHVGGTIRSDDLIGVGTRKLVTNTSGDIIALDNELNYISVPPSSFKPVGHSADTEYTSGHEEASNTTGSTMITPLDLPHHSTLFQIDIYFGDNENGQNLKCAFGRRLHTLNGLQAGDEIEVISASASGGIRKMSISFSNNPDLAEIDNSEYSYFIRAFAVSDSNPNSLMTWSALLDLTSVVIAYYE